MVMSRQISLVCFSVLWIGSVCQSFSQTSEEAAGSLLLVNGRILTMIGDDVLMGNVLMNRGRITYRFKAGEK